MPAESGEPSKKLPERADNLRVDLPFDDAIRAALKVKPQPANPKRAKRPKA